MAPTRSRSRTSSCFTGDGSEHVDGNRVHFYEHDLKKMRMNWIQPFKNNSYQRLGQSEERTFQAVPEFGTDKRTGIHCCIARFAVRRKREGVYRFLNA